MCTAGKLKGLFSGKSEEAAEGDVQEGDQTESTVPAPSSSAAAAEQKTEDTIVLKVQTEFPTFQPLSVAAKSISRARCAKPSFLTSPADADYLQVAST